MTRAPANVLELPFYERAEMAMRAAVEGVILESARLGAPMYIWRDGQVVAMPEEELQAEAARILAE